MKNIRNKVIVSSIITVILILMVIITMLIKKYNINNSKVILKDEIGEITEIKVNNIEGDVANKITVILENQEYENNIVEEQNIVEHQQEYNIASQSNSNNTTHTITNNISNQTNKTDKQTSNNKPQSNIENKTEVPMQTTTQNKKNQNAATIKNEKQEEKVDYSYRGLQVSKEVENAVIEQKIINYINSKDPTAKAIKGTVGLKNKISGVTYIEGDYKQRIDNKTTIWDESRWQVCVEDIYRWDSSGTKENIAETRMYIYRTDFDT